MHRFRKVSVLFLLVGSLFFTGCDASKITDVIQKITTGIQQAIPAIQNIITSIQGAINGTQANTSAPITTTTKSNTAATTTTTTKSNTAATTAPVQTAAKSSAGGSVSSAGDKAISKPSSPSGGYLDSVESSIAKNSGKAVIETPQSKALKTKNAYEAQQRIVKVAEERVNKLQQEVKDNNGFWHPIKEYNLRSELKKAIKDRQDARFKLSHMK